MDPPGARPGCRVGRSTTATCGRPTWPGSTASGCSTTPSGSPGLGKGGRCIGMATAPTAYGAFRPVDARPLVCYPRARTPLAYDTVPDSPNLPHRGVIDPSVLHGTTTARRTSSTRPTGSRRRSACCRSGPAASRRPRATTSIELVRANWVMENPVAAAARRLLPPVHVGGHLGEVQLSHGLAPVDRPRDLAGPAAPGAAVAGDDRRPVRTRRRRRAGRATAGRSSTSTAGSATTPRTPAGSAVRRRSAAGRTRTGSSTARGCASPHDVPGVARYLTR